MFKKTFKADGAFGAYHSALSWLQLNGFSCGSMQAGSPMGVVKGDVLISKWRNLSLQDKKRLDGNLLFSRDREAEVIIYDESLVEQTND